MNITITHSSDGNKTVVEKIEIRQRRWIRDSESISLEELLEPVIDGGEADDSSNILYKSTDDFLPHLMNIGDIYHTSLLFQILMAKNREKNTGEVGEQV